ncbi:MAG: hypothetical protein Q9222_000856 [Ikaeria aurantiellina]
MTGGKVYWPFFSTEVGSSIDVTAYAELMSYIPAPRKVPQSRLTGRLGSTFEEHGANGPKDHRGIENATIDSYRRSTGTAGAIGSNSTSLFLGSKQDSEATHSSPSDGKDRQRKKHIAEVQSNYTAQEKRLVVRYLKEEIGKGNLTEKKWKTIADKLAAHGCRRSQWSIKAWWSRYGREETGFEERKNPHGRSLVTSKQNPEARKRARDRIKALKDESAGSEDRSSRAK